MICFDNHFSSTHTDYFCHEYDLPAFLYEYGEDNPDADPVNWETLGKCAEIYEWNLCPY